MIFLFLELEETLEIIYLTHSGGKRRSPERLQDLHLVPQLVSGKTRSRTQVS